MKSIPWRRARMGTFLATTILGAAVAASGSGRAPMDEAGLKDFATRYTAAWCSQDAASVAAFFAEDGSLKINDGEPVVAMDEVSLERDGAVYRWTLTGTNTGPGGTGRSVRISGYEEWRFSADGLVQESKGHFDEAEYQRQLAGETGGR